MNSAVQGEVADAVDRSRRRRQAELLGLFHGVDHVGPGVGERQDGRARPLREQQGRGEIGRIQRMARRADDLSAGRGERQGGIPLQGLAERVIHGQEIPRVEAGRRQRARRRGALAPGVGDPLHGGRRAELAAEVGGHRARRQGDPAAVLHQVDDAERDPGIREVHDAGHPLLIDPAPRDREADIRLVLVVGGQDLDLQSAGLLGEILEREVGGGDRARPDLIRERAAHVAEHADLDAAAGHLGGRRRGERDDEGGHSDRG